MRGGHSSVDGDSTPTPGIPGVSESTQNLLAGIMGGDSPLEPAILSRTVGDGIYGTGNSNSSHDF